MHYEAKETFIDSPRFAEAITLPRQPDYVSNGSAQYPNSQRTINEGFIPEPVMQQGITIPRPLKQKPLPRPVNQVGNAPKFDS